jgi:hypothetical protein
MLNAADTIKPKEIFASKEEIHNLRDKKDASWNDVVVRLDLIVSKIRTMRREIVAHARRQLIHSGSLEKVIG